MWEAVGSLVAVDLDGRLLTDVPAVQVGWGTAEARDLGDVSAQQLKIKRPVIHERYADRLERLYQP